MTNSAIYDAIIFDVGGTLLHVTHDPQDRALQRVAHLGAVSLPAFRAALNETIADWRRAGGEAAHEDLPETWVRHYARALASARFSGDCAAAAHLIEDAFLLDGWEVFGDAIPLLQLLRARGIPLGVVSNWPATLEATLEKAGLRSYFSVVIGSGRVGYAKPHPEIFRIAAKQLGREPARLLHVGDSVEHDVVAARLAGLNAILLDRHNRHDAESPRITDLTTLEAYLDSGA
jgi:putative hydrolase of the HAD superfamily